MDFATQSKIRELSMGGYGYRKIASVLNISPNSVKSYLKRNPVDNVDFLDFQICKYCGVSLESENTRPDKVFCSKKCKNQWWNRNPNVKSKSIELLVCPCCNKQFYSYKSRSRKYCSMKCYDKTRGVSDYNENDKIIPNKRE